MSDARRRGIPFVVAAPSGTGKTTVCREVVRRDPQVTFSVSHTTRLQRERETDGVDYHFVTAEEFQRLVNEGAFLEWAVYNENRYGTSWAAIEAPLRAGRDVLLEIEVQGARQVREREIGARFIFLLPPSEKILRERLHSRETDSEEQIARRMERAKAEVAAIDGFDYAVINDALERCVADVLEIVRAERAGAASELRARYDARAAKGSFERASEGA